MRFVASLVFAALATEAGAEVLDTKLARKALFSLKGYEVELSETLPKDAAKVVEAIVPMISSELNQPVRYYAAIAWSPDDGVVHESLRAAMNHHNPDVAGRAAVAACETLRSEGATPCEVAALILPRRYEERPLTMSLDATAAFDKAYRKARSPKAFAISRVNGGWGMGASDAEALAACQESSGSDSCVIVVRD